jgi:hypothetical protein
MLTEAEAFEMLGRIRTELGWALVVMTRGDAEGAWRDEVFAQDESDDPVFPAELTLSDEQWDRIRHTWEWKKGFESDSIMDSAWELVNGAVQEAMAATEDE